MLRSFAQARTLEKISLLAPANFEIGVMFDDDCLSSDHEGAGSGFSVSPLTQMQREFLQGLLEEEVEEAQEEGGLDIGLRGDFLDQLYDLAACWGSTKGVVKTIYVVVMWWNGRDVMVEEIVSGGLSAGIDAHVLVSEGVRIGCWRLQKLLEGFRKEKGLKGILGVLDADTTMYVKDVASKVERAEKEKEKGKRKGKIMSVQATQHVVLHLLRYSKAAEGAEGVDRVHSLSILANMLLDQSLKFIKKRELEGAGGK